MGFGQLLPSRGRGEGLFRAEKPQLLTALRDGGRVLLAARSGKSLHEIVAGLPDELEFVSGSPDAAVVVGWVRPRTSPDGAAPRREMNGFRPAGAVFDFSYNGSGDLDDPWRAVMSAPVPGPLTPVALSKDGADRLVIEWNDGHRSVYAWTHLRRTAPAPAAAKSARSRPIPSASSSRPNSRPSPPSPCRASAATPTRSSGATATTPASSRWNTCARCVSVRLRAKQTRLAGVAPCPRQARSSYRGAPSCNPHGGPPPKIALPNIKYVVAVASGKGGVGKSTVAANLALALMQSRRAGSASWTPTSTAPACRS